MRYLLTFLLLAGFLSGCLFKDVLTDEADDIVKARLYLYGHRPMLVTLESVFQAVSKESGRGMTRISGFNVQRISVYDLKDGSLVVRKKTGRQITDPIVFLGCTEGRIWFYTPADGLFALHPESLEVVVSQSDILAKNPGVMGSPATCEWYQLPQYYQMNEVTGNLVLTDNQGYRFRLDAGSLVLTRLEEEYRDFDPRPDRILETGISFPPWRIDLSGDLRKQLRVNRIPVGPEFSFLEGQFLIDRDPVRQIAGIDASLSVLMASAEPVYRAIMDLQSLNGGSGPSWRSAGRDSLNRLQVRKTHLEQAIRDLERSRPEITAEGFSHSYMQPLAPDTNSLLVYHSSGTNPDARIMISRIGMQGFTRFRLLWSTEIPGLFFNPAAADKTSAFQEVFSKGSPEFRYSFAGISGERLILVKMLHAACLDLKTGALIWKIRI